LLETLSVLTTSVRYAINEATASFWSDAEIALYLNEGQELFCTKTKCLVKYYTYTLTADDIKNDREVRLYTDFIAFAEGGVTYKGKQLKPTSIKELDEWGGNWRSDTGTPTRYYLRGDMLGFYPKPTAGDAIAYYGIERAATLSGDTTPLSGDYRTIAFRTHIRDYAISKCWEKKNEMNKSDRYMMLFEKGVREANAILSGGQDQSTKIIPEYISKGSSYRIRYGDTSVFD